MEHTDNLVSLLQRHAGVIPNDLAFTFVNNRDETESLTFSSLWNKANIIAQHLVVTTLPQSRVILLYPPGLDFINAFMGCVIANVIAVPCYIPANIALAKKFFAIYHDSRPSQILVNTESNKQIARAQSSFWGVSNEYVKNFQTINKNLINTDKLVALSSNKDFNLESNKISFLQYTSGSTNEPKGVIVSNKNLNHNLELLTKFIKPDDNSSLVSWLPHNHDMGLIGGILFSIYNGIHAQLMSPLTFLQNKYKWLQLISNAQAHITIAPNFAYEVCARQLTDDQIRNLDLSSLRVVCTGAEPIHKLTMENFISRMKPAGLLPHSITTAYGLAEATLAVAMKSGITSYSVNNQERICCGKPFLKIKIVDPKTKLICKDETVGEIWIRGESVGQGYWNNQKLTKKCFKAKIKNDAEKLEYLRTGDLGFIYQDELYITGRLKDVIIINGMKYYPQDIEYSVKTSHPDLLERTSVAFSVDCHKNGTEKLIILCEVMRATTSSIEVIDAAIRKKILEEHQLIISDLIFVNSSLPKTTSGKIRRNYCKEAYKNNVIEERIGRIYGPSKHSSSTANNH